MTKQLNTENLRRLKSEAEKADEALRNNNALLKQAGSDLRQILSRNPYWPEYRSQAPADDLGNSARCTLKDPRLDDKVYGNLKQKVQDRYSVQSDYWSKQTALIKAVEAANSALLSEIANVGPAIEQYAVQRHEAAYRDAVASLIPFCVNKEEAERIARDLAKCRDLERQCFKWRTRAKDAEFTNKAASAIDQARVLLGMLN